MRGLSRYHRRDMFRRFDSYLAHKNYFMLLTKYAIRSGYSGLWLVDEGNSTYSWTGEIALRSLFTEDQATTQISRVGSGVYDLIKVIVNY